MRSDREHRVTLFEQDAVPGGHVATVTVDAADGPVAVDTGFIVYNERTYPRFVGPARRARASRRSQATCRSDPPATPAGSRTARAAPAASSRTRRTLARPSHWRMLADVARFYRHARETLDAPAAQPGDARCVAGRAPLRPRLPGALHRPDHLGRVVDGGRPGARVPGRLPAPLPRQPRADRLRQRAPVAGRPGRLEDLRRAAHRGAPEGAVRTGSPVVRRSRVTRSASPSGPRRAGTSGSTRSCMATHADDALRLLATPTSASAASWAGFEYSDNQVVLHTDADILPAQPAGLGIVERPHRRIAAARRCPHHDLPHEPPAVDPGAGRLLRLAQPGRPDPRRTGHPRAAMSHPMYTFETLRHRRACATCRAGARTWFAGAHLGYGFHEDGCRSGFEVAELMGMRRLRRPRHEVPPARGQGPTPPVAARSPTAWSTTSGMPRSTLTSWTQLTAGFGCSGRTVGAWPRSGTRTTCRSRLATCRREIRATCGPRASSPTAGG